VDGQSVRDFSGWVQRTKQPEPWKVERAEGRGARVGVRGSRFSTGPGGATRRVISDGRSLIANRQSCGRSGGGVNGQSARDFSGWAQRTKQPEPWKMERGEGRGTRGEVRRSGFEVLHGSRRCHATRDLRWQIADRQSPIVWPERRRGGWAIGPRLQRVGPTDQATRALEGGEGRGTRDEGRVARVGVRGSRFSTGPGGATRRVISDGRSPIANCFEFVEVEHVRGRLEFLVEC